MSLSAPAHPAIVQTSSVLLCNESAFSQLIATELGESADRLGGQLAVGTEVGRCCTDVVRRWRARRRPGTIT